MKTTILKAATEKQTLRREIYKHRDLYFLILPGLLYFLIFCYGPMYGVQIAFKDFWTTRGIWGSQWVGLENFRKIFEMQKFWLVLRNSLVINVYKLVFYFPVPIILALLMNELQNQKFKRVVQTVVYVPHFISWVVISSIVFSLFATNGPVNEVLTLLGMENVNFLSNVKTFRSMLVGTSIWKEAGWGTIIYLATMSGISPDLYEAATIDGANRWKKLTGITIPSIAPTITVLLIMRFGTMMNGGFDQVFNMYNSAVYEVGDVVETYVYRIGLTEGKYSMGTAVNLFLNVINCFLLVSVNKISKKISGSGLY